VNTPTPPAIRVDKWLWAVRLYKTRTLAAEACQGGHIRINGHPAKPARDVHVGDLITARTGAVLRTFRVRAILENRVGAALVPDYLEDLTPPEEAAKPREPGRRAAGAGRPTKRERRVLDAWLHLPVDNSDSP
jgi:ribosome-associated heat shock protein Hsp15